MLLDTQTAAGFEKRRREPLFISINNVKINTRAYLSFHGFVTDASRVRCLEMVFLLSPWPVDFSQWMHSKWPHIPYILLRPKRKNKFGIHLFIYFLHKKCLGWETTFYEEKKLENIVIYLLLYVQNCPLSWSLGCKHEHIYIKALSF